jgi:hypothetical protein
MFSAPSLETQVAALRRVIVTWKGKLSDFKQYTTREFEMIKLLGAGNAAGAIAAVTYLTTAPRGIMLAIIAKLCFVAFALGIALFVCAYWIAFHFERDMTVTFLVDEGESKYTGDPGAAIEKLAKLTRPLGPTVATSLVCFIVGGILLSIGLLVVI